MLGVVGDRRIALRQVGGHALPARDDRFGGPGDVGEGLRLAGARVVAPAAQRHIRFAPSARDSSTVLLPSPGGDRLDTPVGDLDAPRRIVIAEDASIERTAQPALVHAILVVEHGGRPLGSATGRGLLLVQPRRSVCAPALAVERSATAQEALAVLLRTGVSPPAGSREPSRASSRASSGPRPAGLRSLTPPTSARRAG